MVKLGIDVNNDGVVDEKDLSELMNNDVYPYYESMSNEDRVNKICENC